mmetsp:Transcript_13139/g.28743  ORF Transcript_13139/g.28743 Transcript_13139/m.28743 type:complete len:402 (+) Transcript_13139:92-1297(+)
MSDQLGTFCLEEAGANAERETPPQGKAEIKRAFGAKTFEEEKAMVLEFLKERYLTPLQADALSREISSASEELLRDEEVALACDSFFSDYRSDPGLLPYFSEPLRADKRFVLAAVQARRPALECASEKLRADRDFMFAVLDINPYALEYMTEEFRNDKEIVCAAVSKNSHALKYASAELSADIEVVLVAVSSNPTCWRFMGKCLLMQKDSILLFARAVHGYHSPRANYEYIWAKALASARRGISFKVFCSVAASSLAVSGQPAAAPTLLVTLNRGTERGTGRAEGSSFHPETRDAQGGRGRGRGRERRANNSYSYSYSYSVDATLLSGEEIHCHLPNRAGEQPVLNDLAKVLVVELKNRGKMDEQESHIFITFHKCDSDAPTTTTPWDCDRPLSNFLYSQN